MVCTKFINPKKCTSLARKFNFNFNFNFNLLPVRVARRQEICPIMRWVPTLEHPLENDVRVAFAAGSSQCVFIIDPRENDDSGF
jgi:hypothetical protein